MHDLSESSPRRRRPGDVQFFRVAAARLAVALGIVVVWKAAAASAGPLYVPDPEIVFGRLVDGFRSGSAIRATVATIRLATAGLLVGIGVGAAAVLALSITMRPLAAAERYVVVSAAVPKYALMPLFILWLGIGDAPKLMLIALLVFYPVFISGLAGVRAVDRRLVATIRVLGAGRLAALRHVVWYSTLPFAFAALKVAVPRAVSGAIVSELLIGDDGIGFLIESARQNFDTAGLFAGVGLAMMLAVVAAFGLAPLERRAMPWRPQTSRPMI